METVCLSELYEKVQNAQLNVTYHR